MIERNWFTQEEASAKVGRKIKTLVPFSGVPKDTTGSVISDDPAAGQIEAPYPGGRRTLPVYTKRQALGGLVY